MAASLTLFRFINSHSSLKKSITNEHVTFLNKSITIDTLGEVADPNLFNHLLNHISQPAISSQKSGNNNGPYLKPKKILEFIESHPYNEELIIQLVKNYKKKFEYKHIQNEAKTECIWVLINVILRHLEIKLKMSLQLWIVL